MNDMMKKFKLGHSLIKNSMLAELTLKTQRNYSRPSIMKFSPTYRCNSCCIMCDSWRMKQEQIGKEKELSLSEIEKVFSEARELGAYYLTINGGVGEPMMRNDIVEILKIAERKGFASNLITNGLNLNRDLAVEILSTNPFKVHISLDAATDATYEKIRGVKGGFEKAVQSLKMLCEVKKELGVSTRIHSDTVIMKFNLHEIIDIVKLVESIGAEFLCQPVVIFDNPYVLKIKEDLWIDKEQLPEAMRIIDELKEIKMQKGIVLNTIKHLDLIKKYFENPDSVRYNNVCIFPLTSFIVHPHGEVKTCLEEIGNIRDESLSSIWKSANITKQNLYCEKECINPCFHLHNQIMNYFYEDAILPVIRKIKK